MISLYDFLVNKSMTNNLEYNKIILDDISKHCINNLMIGDKIICNNNKVCVINNIKENTKMIYRIHQKYGNSYILDENSKLALINKNGIKINISILDYIKYIEDINNFVILNDENIHELSNNDNKYEKNNDSFITKKYEELLEDNFVKINNEDIYIDIKDKIMNKEHIYYGYKNHIIFNVHQLNIKDSYYILEPYLFGYWYGTHKYTNFKTTKSKNHINLYNKKQIDYILQNIPRFDLFLTRINNNSETYYIHNKNINDIIEIFITKYNLQNIYDIPKIYKYTNIEHRLKVLSGIIDASFIYESNNDSQYYVYKHCDNNKTEYIENVLELANSLGAYTQKKSNNEIVIYVKKEKKIGQMLLLENLENMSEIVIEKLNNEKYYDIELNERDQKYLLYDYTILHSN